MPHLMDTYNRLPVAFTHGEGAWLYDSDGKRYLDALAGIAVNTLGHAHPRLVQALAHQASRLIHTSNLYRVPQQEALSDKLAEISGLDEVFFCNSGCEANEAAIKLARLFGHGKGVDLPVIVVMEKAFHGRTLATLSATGSRKVQAGFEPLVSGFARVPYNDFPAVEQLDAHNKNVVAIMLESIQGEGGINIADHDYLRALRRLCDERGWLLMLDAVQCGMGRTGKWFGHQHAGIQVDVLTLAKGLGSGVPIGACLAGGRAAGTFKPGNHGSTFGGNPFACTAGLTTIRAIEEEGLMAHAVRIGEAIRAGFRTSLAGTAGVVDVRGVGLMIGIELDRPCADLVRQALEAGLLINVTNDKVVRLLPPLIFADDEARLLVAGLTPLIRRFLAG
ncbi:MAG: aspartate aminotransferase family protein [Sterolibacteriaceae bacterium]|nr:aspartate aminotransferase family protein [Candidatus Methylophosphatis haderslevensis]